MAWVGRMDAAEEAVAALSISIFAVWIFGSLAALLSVGLSALVARYVGAGRQAGARYVASQGIRGSVALGVICGIAGLLLAPTLFAAVGTEEGVTRAGTAYVRIYWGGGLATLLLQAGAAIFRGHGNTRAPFVVALGSLALNAVIDPLFIFGWGPLPALGVAGSAWATILASALSAMVLGDLLRRSGHVDRARPADDVLRLRDSTPLSRPGMIGIDWAVQRRVARVGVPIAISGVVFTLIYVVIGRITEEAGGSAAVAGLGIGHRGEAPAWVLGTGYATAAASLVGRRLGADDPDGANRCAWRAIAQCVLLCVFWAAILIAAADWIAAVFIDSSEPAFAYATMYYRIAAWCIAFQATEIVVEGAFGGAGLTVPPMLITVLLTAVRVPIAYWVVRSTEYGIEGIWWTLSLTAIVRGIVMALWFSRGTWRGQGV